MLRSTWLDARFVICVIGEYGEEVRGEYHRLLRHHNTDLVIPQIVIGRACIMKAYIRDDERAGKVNKRLNCMLKEFKSKPPTKEAVQLANRIMGCEKISLVDALVFSQAITDTDSLELITTDRIIFSSDQLTAIQRSMIDNGDRETIMKIRDSTRPDG